MTFLWTPASLILSLLVLLAGAACCVVSWQRGGRTRAVAALELLRFVLIVLVLVTLNQPELQREVRPDEDSLFEVRPHERGPREVRHAEVGELELEEREIHSDEVRELTLEERHALEVDLGNGRRRGRGFDRRLDGRVIDFHDGRFD